MKLNPQEIRAAMDGRLSFLTENSARRERIREAVSGGGKFQSKRYPAMAIALAAVMAVSVALVGGLGLFSTGARNDARNPGAAPQALPAEYWAFAAGSTQEHMKAYITYTHYDGDSLTLAYTIENGTRWEPFAPVQGQLADMQKIEGGLPAVLLNGENNPLLLEMERAMENGTAAGVTCYSVFFDNRTETNGGIDLGYADRTGGEITDGIERAFRQYTSLGFDDEILDVTLHQWNSAQSYYFDGTDLFVINQTPLMDGTMQASIVRTDEPVAAAYARWEMAGATVIQPMGGTQTTHEGALVTATAVVSPMYGEITLTASGAGFAQPNAQTWARITQEGVIDDPVDNYWYIAAVRDAGGRLLHSDSCAIVDAHTITVTFEGNGTLPEAVSVALYLRKWDSSTEVMGPLVLTADPATLAQGAIIWDDFLSAPPTLSPAATARP